MGGFVYDLHRLRGGLYRSKDPQGRPCLVFLLEEASQPGRVFRGLSVQFFTNCRVRFGSGVLEKACAIMVCTDATFVKRFEAVVDDAIRQAREDSGFFSTDEAVAAFVQEYAALFSVLPPLEPRAQRGLWGELAVLLACPDTDGAVEAWTGPTRHIVDFARNKVEIEVKTALGSHFHHFQDAQINAPVSQESTRVVWSICLSKDPSSGSTLSEMVNRVREKLSRRIAFENLLKQAGYDDLETYDTKWGISSVRVVEQRHLPRIQKVPKEISDIEFEMDLSRLPSLTDSQRLSLLRRLSAGIHGASEGS